MANINCNNCKNMVLDTFSGVHTCGILKCGCHSVKSNFLLKVGEPVPRAIPDVGEDKCPGMVAETIKTVE